jgi:hypothetical protein
MIVITVHKLYKIAGAAPPNENITQDITRLDTDGRIN